MINARKVSRRGVLLRATAMVSLIIPAAAMIADPANAVTMKVYASGFQNPRGLKFGPDGFLYVAEGGPGGTNSTVGKCTQVPAPLGPDTGAQTGGRISKVVNGSRVTVNDQFATAATSPLHGRLVLGVADIAWVGSTLYALTAGGGCSHGVTNKPNGVYRVNGNGTPTLVGNLSEFQMTHPVAHPEPDDFEPDGTWYSMIALRGDLYAIDPNHGELDRITTSGAISRVADISATQGHIVPTSMDFHGNFYVGNLGLFPIQVGSSKILKITPSGALMPVVDGLTTVLGVAFDNHDRMYVLENTVGPALPTPFHGEIVRIDPNGNRALIAQGLPLPTGMTFGPDGALYVSIWGFGPPIPPGSSGGPGKVLRISGF